MAFNDSHTNHFGDRATVSFRITIVPDEPAMTERDAAAVAPHAAPHLVAAAPKVPREGGGR